jgi:hypothetical protein
LVRQARLAGRIAVGAKILMVASAGIILALGVVHLLYTFRGPNLTPRDPTLQVTMRQVSPVLTSQTTMWRAWVGFNASHSFGALLFGLIYGYLAISNSALLFGSPFLLVVGFAMLGGWAVLGKLYWFSVPLRGICVSFACYIASIAMSRIV